jgi:hypothetical protein
MIQITIKNTHKGPSNDIAIAFAKMLVANKKRNQEEATNIKNTVEYQAYRKKLDLLKKQ